MSSDFFSRKQQQNPQDLERIIIMLNRPCKSGLTRKIIHNATKLYSAEGGINHLYYTYPPKSKKEHLPDLIFEDSDEFRSEAANFYKDFDIPRSDANSQDYTALEQTLTYILDNNKFQTKKNNLQIVVIGGFGGRLDTTLQNISTLIKYTSIFKSKGKNANIFLINNSSLVTCMLPGKTKYIRNLEFEHYKGVGIVPVQEQTKLKSLGFRWDLDESLDGQMYIGNFLSTNNEFEEKEVYIETDKPIIFITKIIRF